MDDVLKIGSYEFESRLIVGTGKYSDFATMVRAHEASGAELVTVAIARVNLSQPNEETLLDYIDRNRFTILPNTAGAYTAQDAIFCVSRGTATVLGHLDVYKRTLLSKH